MQTKEIYKIAALGIILAGGFEVKLPKDERRLTVQEIESVVSWEPCVWPNLCRN